MAATGTPTPNIGLRIPIGTDPASVDDINYNSNLLDTKLGAVGNDSVQDQIDTLNGKMATLNSNLPSLKIYVKEITFSFNNQTDKSATISTETGGIVNSNNIVGFSGIASNYALKFVLSSNKSQIYGFYESAITADVNVLCVFFYV